MNFVIMQRTFSLDIVRFRHDRALRYAKMVHQHTLHLCCSDPMPADVHYVINATSQPNVTICITITTVSYKYL